MTALDAFNKNQTKFVTVAVMVVSALVAVAASVFLVLLKYAWALNLWILCISIDTAYVIAVAINKAKQKRERMLRKYADVLAGDSLKISGRMKKRMLCGIKAYHTGRYQAALTVFESLRKEDCMPDTRRAVMMFMGMCHAEMKHYDEARWLFEEVLDFQYHPQLLYRMGIVFGKHKQYENAERYFIRALALLPDDMTLLLCLSEVEDHLKKHGKVLEYGKRALDLPEIDRLLNKKRAGLLTLMAKASLETYDFEKAYGYAELILELYPKDVDAHYVLAAYYAVRKDEEKHREAMKIARIWGGDPKVVDRQMAEFLDGYAASLNEKGQ